MQIRTTSFTQFERAVTELRRRQSELLTHQRALSSGTRLGRPSEGPGLVRSFLGATADVQRLETGLANLSQVKQQVGGVHQGVRDVHSILVEATLLASEAPQVTEPAERKVIANQLNHLIDRLFAIANERQEFGYLFSGNSSDVQPFVRDEQGNIRYVGNDRSNTFQWNGGPLVERLLSGDVVFGAPLRGETLYHGQTGAAPALGTDTGTGRAELQIRHTLTTYAAGSGLAAGNSSPGGDTVLGPLGRHSIQLEDLSGTGAFGTVSLNGGAAISFTSAETNLRLTGPEGEVVYLDLSNITAGFSGTVDLQGDGVLSIDGGLTEIPLDFSTLQTVVDSRTSAVTHVDTSGVARTGVETIEYTGTANVFEALQALRDEILNERRLDSNDWLEAMSRRRADLDRLADRVLEIVGSTGVDLQYLETTELELSSLKLAAESRQSEIGGVDYSDAILRLQQHQFQLEVILAATSRIFNANILNYLT